MHASTRRAAWSLGLAAVVLSSVLTLAAPGAASAGPVLPGRTVRLDKASNGQTVKVRVGDRVIVTLTADPGWTWSVPTTGDGTVVRHVGPIFTSMLPSYAFTVVGGGTATLDAYRRCVAPPGMACPRIVFPWTVTLVTTP